MLYFAAAGTARKTATWSEAIVTFTVCVVPEFGGKCHALAADEAFALKADSGTSSNLL